MCICMCINIYIYIYIYRERERGRERLYAYIYIYSTAEVRASKVVLREPVLALSGVLSDLVYIYIYI